MSETPDDQLTDVGGSDDVNGGAEPNSEAAGPNLEVSAPPTWRQRLKFVGLSLVLAVSLVLGLEIWIRLGGYDRAELSSPLMPGDFVLVHQEDDELFYAPKPNLDNVEWEGFHVSTNSHGLRGAAELGPKQPGEFRILSLGESSTFGDKVNDDETYSFLLEEHLKAYDSARPFCVLNAGVCAYSSFQSLKYLETRGLALEPDMVLFYHEFSDFLPTANRDSLSHDSQGIPLTDKQLYESKQHRWNRRLLSMSALYRYLHARLSEPKLEASEKRRPRAPGRVPIPEALEAVTSTEGAKRLNLPARVPPEDRRANLERLRNICRSNGVELVIIHPSYWQSVPHECDLTEFCEEFGVPMFDAHASLHPEPEVEEQEEPTVDVNKVEVTKPPVNNGKVIKIDLSGYKWPGGGLSESNYADLWHPNAKGHASMAQALFEFLVRENLITTADAESL